MYIYALFLTGSVLNGINSSENNNDVKAIIDKTAHLWFGNVADAFYFTSIKKMIFSCLVKLSKLTTLPFTLPADIDGESETQFNPYSTGQAFSRGSSLFLSPQHNNLARNDSNITPTPKEHSSTLK
jgi:hypothetical protein